MSQLSRRRFLRGSLAVAGGSLLAGCQKTEKVSLAPRKILGANDKLRVAVAGLNGRGSSHMGAYSGMKDVEIVYLIDPDSRLFASNVKRIADKAGYTPKTVQDVRRVLEDKSIDAISIATPNHWHSLMTIWACQAGKDVYVEKPLSHNVREGCVAAEAAKRYGRVVQHGTQSRSDEGWMKSVAAVRSGKLGKLQVVRAFCYKGRPSIGFKSPKTPPPELNYDIWLGPAPEETYHENLVHYNWHWFWNTGNGDIGNQGVHQMDIALWALGDQKLPASVLSLGGRFGYEDQAETPNTLMSVMDFGDAQLIFEVRGLPTERYRGVSVGNIFQCEAGDIVDKKFYPRGSDKPEKLPDVEIHPGPGEGNHFRNFVDAIRTGKSGALNAPIEKGYYSAALCHLANVSYRLGEQAPFNKKTQAFGDNKEAYDTLARMEEHLGKGNRLKLESMNYQLGKKLTVDAAAWSIKGEPEANHLLNGVDQYRQSYRVPMSV